MLRLRSLTAKLVFISAILLSFLALVISIAFEQSHHLKDEATRINIAGSLRFRAYETAWLIQKIAERETEEKTSETQRQFTEELNKEIVRFDEIMTALRNGNAKYGLRPMPHKEHLAQLDAIASEWDDNIKPLLLRISRLPIEASERDIRERLRVFDERIEDYVENNIGGLVDSLEENYKNEFARYDSYRVYVLGFFTIAGVFVVIYARRDIVLPVLKLRNAAEGIKGGRFDVRVDIKGDDEVAQLSGSFNMMAQALEVHIRELDVLNRISEAASQTLAVEVLLEKVMDAILNLEPLQLEKKGAIFLYDEKKKALELIVSRNFGEEQTKGCGLVNAGECLCGIVAEQKEILLSESSIEDKRHSKVYPDAREHGHIILPLKSRDKMAWGPMPLSAGRGQADREGDIVIHFHL